LNKEDQSKIKEKKKLIQKLKNKTMFRTEAKPMILVF